MTQDHTSARPPLKVLLVGLGSRGGVGRYELLLAGALDALALRGLVEWRSVWRHAHPQYLDPNAERDTASDSSLMRLVARVMRHARGWHPDVVVFSHINVARLGPTLPLLGTRAPYVVGTLGMEVWERLRWTRRLPLKGASAVLAISNYTRQRVIDVQGVRADRCTTVHLALEDHWVASADAMRTDGHRQTSALTPPPISLLSVCRLERSARDKGVDWVLHSVADLRRSHPGLRYTVVGTGDDLPYLQRLSTELDLDDHVKFAGGLNHSDLLEAYSDCDVFVLPTRREGFGLVFLEAMAFRKPIVAMASAGTLDVVTNGHHGVLVAHRADLTAAIEHLIRNPALAHQMGEAGYQAASGYFALRSFLFRLSSLLRGVADSA